jgi:hypothetical protein
MSTIRMTSEDAIAVDVLAGPETFAIPTITVVEGFQIKALRPKATPIPGMATLFRLGGDAFGMMHEITDLRQVDGRILGVCREPVEIGSLVSVGWQDASRTACRGVVAFSRRDGEGWLITLDIDYAMAA